MAGRTDLFTTTLPSTVGVSPELSGSGSPEGAVPGIPGQTFVNVDTLELYVKIAGVQKIGWSLVGKKSVPVVDVTVTQPTTNIFSGVGSPVGVITPITENALYRDNSTGQNYWWANGAWNPL